MAVVSGAPVTGDMTPAGRWRGRARAGRSGLGRFAGSWPAAPSSGGRPSLRPAVARFRARWAGEWRFLDKPISGVVRGLAPFNPPFCRRREDPGPDAAAGASSAVARSSAPRNSAASGGGAVSFFKLPQRNHGEQSEGCAFHCFVIAKALGAES